MCDATSCPNGCCNGKICVPYASETSASCGAAGAACAACATNVACNTGLCLGCGSFVKLTAGGAGSTTERFGSAVSLNAGNLFVAAHGEASNVGWVYTFAGAGATWSSTGTIFPGNAMSFGDSVSVSGSNAIVSGISSSGTSGAIYPLNKTGNSWFEGAAISPADATNTSNAPSVALDGTAILSVSLHSASIYSTSGGAAQATFTPDFDTASGYFGRAAISGSTALVGAEQLASDGQLAHFGYLYTRTGSTWSTTPTKLIPSDLASNSSPHFYWSLALDSDTAVLATSGGAYIFTLSGSNWIPSQKLTAVNANFGGAVALSGNLLAISDGGGDQGFGHVYLYGRSGGTWIAGPTLSGSTSAGDDFGWSLATDGTTLAVGAPLALATGGQGAVYVFACQP